MFNSFCLRPELNVMQCDIRLAEDRSPLLPNTKVVLLLGECAMHERLPETQNNTIGEMRGSVFQQDGIWYIPSFFPQDAVDIKNFEREHNPLSKSYQEDEDDGDEDDGDSIKRHGRTSRKNYAFWLKADCKKAKYLLQHGHPPAYETPTYRTYPSASEVIAVLEETEGKFLYFDIETDYEEANLQCFSFSFDGRTIYNVPILDNNYQPAYTAFHHVLRALAVAFSRNTVVAHNGATFDFFVMAYKYRIPVVKCYDTMLAIHRCWPDIERSLGHATSLFTWERFHKDEDSLAYFTREQMMKRLAYCGKDVYTMFLIHQAITLHARTIPGLEDSIATVMRCIRPYLISSLQGIRYDKQEVTEKKRENDLLMMQYMRIIELLIGKSGMLDIRSGSKKPSHMPGSNKQCCRYFHDILGYPVVARGKVNDKGQRNPSLAKKAMFKLRLSNDNPVIDFIIAYRQVALETSTPLGFVPFRDDNNQIVNIHTYGQQTLHAVPQSSVNTPTLL